MFKYLLLFALVGCCDKPVMKDEKPTNTVWPKGLIVPTKKPFCEFSNLGDVGGSTVYGWCWNHYSEKRCFVLDDDCEQDASDVTYGRWHF